MLIGIESKSQNGSDQLTFHSVCCGDLDNLNRDHDCAAQLISRDTFTYAHFPGADSRFPLLFYLKNGEKICSYFRTIPDEITVNGEKHPWAWTGDNFTYPEFRGSGLSTRLQSHATQHLHQLGIGRGSVFSTDVTLHIFEKLGFTRVGYVRRYLLIRSAEPLLKAHVPNAPIRRILQVLSKPAARIATGSLQLWNGLLDSRKPVEVQSTCTDAELKALLDRLANKQLVHFSLHADVLLKKLEIAKRTGDMSLWLIRENCSGDARGYAILRERLQVRPLAERYRDFRLMTLMDFELVEGDSRAAAGLVGQVVRHFLRSDCDVLEIISNNSLVNRAAMRRGLIPVGKGMSFSYSVPQEWNWTSKMAQMEFWPLTSFCGDGFSF